MDYKIRLGFETKYFDGSNLKLTDGYATTIFADSDADAFKKTLLLADHIGNKLFSKPGVDSISVKVLGLMNNTGTIDQSSYANDDLFKKFNSEIFIKDNHTELTYSSLERRVRTMARK